jgi:hypothetical protein
MINKHLLRLRRTGTPFSKDVTGTDLVVSLEELRATLRPSLPERIVSVRIDSESEGDETSDDDEQVEKFKETCKMLDAARLLPPEEERKVLIGEIFERGRQSAYELINENREAIGQQPWYILTREEVKLVGFVLPYSLVTHPNHEFIKEAIKTEGHRVKELKADGMAATPWSTWNDYPQNRSDMSGSVSEKMRDV